MSRDLKGRIDRLLSWKDRFPGASTEQTGVRLPDLGGMRPYDPKVEPLLPTPPNPRTGFAEDYETFTNPVSFAAARNAMIDCYTTRKRWRACDVYANFEFDPSDGVPPRFVLSVIIYAVTQGGGRVIVGSGRIDYNPTFPLPGFPGTTANQVWIASARVVAERYQVTCSIAAFSAPLGRMNITIAAADEMVQAPHLIGSVTREGIAGASANFSGVGFTPPPQLEVVQVRGITDAAFGDLRYLQLYDTQSETDAILAASGEQPRMEWPLGFGAGTGVVDDDVFYRCVADSVVGPPILRNAPFLVVSSTPGAYTPTIDGVAVLTVR
jgi:hypothetical protein